MSQRTVNAQQLEVLKWVVDGCPDGVMAGSTYKSTALALQSRRLVRVTKKRGVWRAEATDAGRHFAEHDEYPPGHWKEVKGATSPTSVSGPQPVRAVRERKVTGLRPTDQMVADLLAAGGELQIEADDPSYWENLASSAMHFGKVPEGKEIDVGWRSYRDRTISVRLIDAPVWKKIEQSPIRVADRLVRPHPLVQALKDDRGQLRVAPPVRSRALRILDAIAKGAVARGHEVSKPPRRRTHHPVSEQLQITIGRHSCTVGLDELQDKVPHEPTAQELREKERYSYYKIPTHDPVPSGRLRLRVRGWSAVSRDVFQDTKTTTLDDKLSAVLQEVELRAAAVEDRDRRHEEERQERHRRWEQIRAEAEIKAVEHYRGEVLMAEVDQWHQAGQLRRYIDAMSDRARDLAGVERERAVEWIGWARRYAAWLDPLAGALEMPPDPKVTSEMLMPFMKGLSPDVPWA